MRDFLKNHTGDYEHTDSLKVSTLIGGNVNPDNILRDILGESFSNYRASWDRARRFQELPPFPIHVDYELISKCNYRCPMCPMSVSTEPPTESLSISKVKELISEGATNGQMAMGFGGLWEPLIVPELPELVSHARSLGLVDIMLNSNGSLLTRDKASDLIESGLTRLMISLDAANDETYSKIRTGGDLSLVEENIRNFLIERKRKNSTLPLLRLSFLLTSLNQDELPKFLERWEREVDFFSIQRFGRFEGLNNAYLFPRGFHKEKAGICAQPFKRLLVRHNGDVLPCCDLSGMDMPVGNIYLKSLKDIWRGDKILSLRKNLKKRIPKLCFLCQSKYQNNL